MSSLLQEVQGLVKMVRFVFGAYSIKIVVVAFKSATFIVRVITDVNGNNVTGIQSNYCTENGNNVTCTHSSYCAVNGNNVTCTLTIVHMYTNYCTVNGTYTQSNYYTGYCNNSYLRYTQ